MPFKLSAEHPEELYLAGEVVPPGRYERVEMCVLATL